MCDVIDALDDTAVIAEVRGKVTELCRRFPVYER
jgi:glycine hydroxymethyltransferase